MPPLDCGAFPLSPTCFEPLDFSCRACLWDGKDSSWLFRCFGSTREPSPHLGQATELVALVNQNAGRAEPPVFSLSLHKPLFAYFIALLNSMGWKSTPNVLLQQRCVNWQQFLKEEDMSYDEFSIQEGIS